MNDFLFEKSPWEVYLDACKSGTAVPAVGLLAMLEGEDDEAVEDAFQMIDDKHLTIDLTSLPHTASSGQTSARLAQEAEYVKNGLDPHAMSETDPLRLYLEEIASIPAAGDEALLAQRAASGDTKAAHALTELGLNRVVQLAAEYSGHPVLLLDLIQEGNVGLWEAVASYSGGEYTAHRDRMIRGAIAKAILLQARSNGIGQKLRRSLQDFRSTDEKLLAHLGHNPSLEEIADEMNIHREEAETLRKMLDDAMLLAQAEKMLNPDRTEPDSEENLAVEDTAYFQMRQRISELLSQLSELDAKILTLRFGLEKGLPMSVEDTAKKLGLTAGEVSARENAALASLRNNE